MRKCPVFFSVYGQRKTQDLIFFAFGKDFWHYGRGAKKLQLKQMLDNFIANGVILSTSQNKEKEQQR
jgi:hypothetical protein